MSVELFDRTPSTAYNVNLAAIRLCVNVCLFPARKEIVVAKRYIIIIGALLLAVVLDAIIYAGFLGVPLSRVPLLYHAGVIVMLTCALAVLGDVIFKGSVLR